MLSSDYCIAPHHLEKQKPVIVGERKMAVFKDTLPWVDKLHVYRHEIKWRNHVPLAAKAVPERFEVPEAEPLRLEYEHLLIIALPRTPCKNRVLEKI